MKYVFIGSLILIVAACGGGGSSSSNYSNLAGTWGPWVSKGEYEALTSDENYNLEIYFSRYGDVALWEMDNDFIAECYGSYTLSGSNLDAQLGCHDSDNNFFDGGFTAKVGSSSMDITSINLDYLSPSYQDNISINLYKNEVHYWEFEQNIQAGIYEVDGIENAFISISDSGQINKISSRESSDNGECEINGYIKEDSDYGLTVQNSLYSTFIGAHGGILSFSGCNLTSGWSSSDNININQAAQSVILRSGSYNNVSKVEITAPGNAISNSGRNTFYLELDLVCDQLNNPTVYGDESGISCNEFYDE